MRSRFAESPEVTELTVDTSAIDTEIEELEAKVRRLQRTKRKMEMEAMAGYLSTKQAAEYLGISVHTMRNMRQAGHGPDHFTAKHLHGRACYYSMEALELYSERKHNERDVA